MEKAKKVVKKTKTKTTAKTVASAAKKVAPKRTVKPVSKPEVQPKAKKADMRKPTPKATVKAVSKAPQKEKKIKKEVAAAPQPVVEEKPIVEHVETVEPVVVAEPSIKEGPPQLKNYVEAVGRRKTSVARTRLAEGKGLFLINGKPALDYFPSDKTLLRILLDRPFSALGRRNKYDVTVKVIGGGVQSQIGAVTHAISRALAIFDVEFRSPLRKAGLLTRDSRMRERHKYGLMGARKKKASPKR